MRKIILDTNVFISGVFFSGPPYRILQGWRDTKIQLVISVEIFQEYQRVAEELSIQFPGIDISEILDLVLVKAEMAHAEALPESVSADSADDMFLACAIASSTKIIVSGDKHLLDISPYRGVTVLKPRQFVDKYLYS